ncbi:MAG: hypothetical protein WKG07_16255 [Hymenobacter sp.]
MNQTGAVTWPRPPCAVHPKEAKAYAVAGDIQTLTDHKKRGPRHLPQGAAATTTPSFKSGSRWCCIDAELNQTDSLLAHTDRALELFPNQASLWFYNGVAHMLRKQPQRRREGAGARPQAGGRTTPSCWASSTRSSATPTTS